MKFPCDMCNSTGEVDTGGQLPSGSFVTDECPYCEGRGFYPLTILQTNYKQRIADAAREIMERWEAWEEEAGREAQASQFDMAASFAMQARITNVLHAMLFLDD